MIRSLRLRLILGAGVLIAIALFLVWLALVALFERHVLTNFVTELSAVIDGVAAQLIVDGDVAALTAAISDQRYNTPAGGRYWQVAARGEVVAQSRSMFADQLPIRDDVFTVFDVEWGPGGEPLIVVSRRITFVAGEPRPPFLVAAAADLDDLTMAVAAFRDDLALMLGLTALLLSVAAIAQSVIGLAPLRRLRDEVVAIRGDHRRRLNETGPSEISPVVNELNSLLDERDRSVARAQARASDLAHALKTPLTVIAHTADNLQQGNSAEAERLMTQVDAVRQRIDRQLAMARLHLGGSSHTDLPTLCHRLVEAVRPLDTDERLDWRLAMPEAMTIVAGVGDAAEAIGNILDNARQWAAVRIVVSAWIDGANGVLAIEDDGPGIPEAMRKEVLARGVRLDENKPGTGLGMAIAADIVQAHGGALRLCTSKTLGGLRAELVWPLA